MFVLLIVFRALWQGGTSSIRLYQALDTQAILVYMIDLLLDLKTINKHYARSFNISYCLYIRRRHSKNKGVINSSPYSSDEANTPWPAGVTRLPRANTNWSENPSLELTPSSSVRNQMGSNSQTNGLVSRHTLLCCRQTVVRKISLYFVQCGPEILHPLFICWWTWTDCNRVFGLQTNLAKWSGKMKVPWNRIYIFGCHIIILSQNLWKIWN